MSSTDNEIGVPISLDMTLRDAISELARNNVQGDAFGILSDDRTKELLCVFVLRPKGSKTMEEEFRFMRKEVQELGAGELAH